MAEEVTRRGYRVSGETLNRWVRDEREFPAVVERIVFELFGITETTKEPPPWWTEAQSELVAEIQENRVEITQLRELVGAVSALRDEMDDALALIAEQQPSPPVEDPAPSGNSRGAGAHGPRPVRRR